MGVDAGTCACDIDDNNEFRCSKSCKNFNKKCKRASDCISNKQDGGMQKKTAKKNKSKQTHKTYKLHKTHKTHKIQKTKDKLHWLKEITNEMVRSKAVDIYNTYKKLPTRMTYENNKLYSIVFSNIEGVDYIELFMKPKKKLHPYQADVFVVVKKHVFVPDYLIGALQYASETIGIEQLMIDKKYNDKYHDTGIKDKILVSGSCATITISVITIQFIIDMVNSYTSKIFYEKGYKKVCVEFREEYDKRVGNYLCGGGIVPDIPWFKNKVEREYLQGPWSKETRETMGCPSNFKGSIIANKASTLV